jgi:heme oxygenase
MGSLAEAFGCAYVMEGATLGGRHISAMMETSSIPHQARDFFRSYGAGVGDRWKEFIAALETFSKERPDSAPDIVAAACECFASLQRWMAGEVSATVTPNQLVQSDSR